MGKACGKPHQHRDLHQQGLAEWGNQNAAQHRVKATNHVHD
jgi:hypothetical protein